MPNHCVTDGGGLKLYFGAGMKLIIQKRKCATSNSNLKTLIIIVSLWYVIEIFA